MEVLEGFLVVLGRVVLLIVGLFAQDLFITGLLSGLRRLFVLAWSRRGILVIVLGATLVVAGIVGLHLRP